MTASVPKMRVWTFRLPQTPVWRYGFALLTVAAAAVAATAERAAKADPALTDAAEAEAEKAWTMRPGPPRWAAMAAMVS